MRMTNRFVSVPCDEIQAVALVQASDTETATTLTTSVSANGRTNTAESLKSRDLALLPHQTRTIRDRATKHQAVLSWRPRRG